MIQKIIKKQKEYARMFDDDLKTEPLDDDEWLILVGVPYLLNKLNGEQINLAKLGRLTTKDKGPEI